MKLDNPTSNEKKSNKITKNNHIAYEPSGTFTAVVPPPRTMVPAPDVLHGSLRPDSADAVPALQSSQSMRSDESARPYLPGRHERHAVFPPSF